MNPFDKSHHPSALDERSAAASARLAGASLPSWELEEWRYSPVGELDLARYEPSEGSDAMSAEQLAEIKATYSTPNLTVFRNGALVHTEGVAQVEDAGPTTRLDGNGDLFADLNELYATSTTVISTAAGAMVVDDIVVVHLVDRDGVAVFPRLIVDAGQDSALKVLEVFQSTDVEALVVPLIEVGCAQAANVGYVAAQHLGPRVWTIGSQISAVGQQGTFRSSVASFGGFYSRMRSDCRLDGRGAHGDLDAIYFGDGEQVLDFRTFQDHNAPDTTSNLLFKGVVDDSSRAIYTGLIRVAESAPGTVAFQTNRNIKLGENSWAESVPNLEIETNDVKCSHASTVGPIDEEQRFYLETRGIPPEVADELIVVGFFDEVIDDLPVKSIEPALRAAIDAKLHGPKLVVAA